MFAFMTERMEAHLEKQAAEEILKRYKEGSVELSDVMLYLKEQPYLDLGYAKVDTHRGVRQGMPEVIYGAGKTKEQILGIVKAMTAKNSADLQKRNTILPKESETSQDGKAFPVLITRMTEEAAEYLSKEMHLKSRVISGPEEWVKINSHCEDDMPDLLYHKISRTGVIGRLPEKNGIGKIVVATGGTSDLPVAEEAAVTAEVFGNEVVRLYDVGVAGLHRLLDHMDEIMSASVIIAIAGMEGALASVIGGIADCPVIAVPTSVGYGASFGGLSALLSMLNSCASGVSVVNIDNGFGAGYQAGMINHPK